MAFVVKPGHRQRGIGASLLTQFVRANPNLDSIALRVGPNSPAVRLMERFGFEVARERDQAVVMRRQAKSQTDFVLMTQLSDRALTILHEWVQSESLRKHCYAVAAAMRHFAGRTQGADADTWQAVGLLHDMDYERHPNTEQSATEGHRSSALPGCAPMVGAKKFAARFFPTPITPA